MQEATKDWFTHCVVPHSMHEVSEEAHEMLHDPMFMVLNAAIIAVFIFAAFIALSIWFPPAAGYAPYAYNPIQIGM
jgi:hypothetical protein